MRNIINKIKTCFKKFEDWYFRGYVKEIERELDRQLHDSNKKLREIIERGEYHERNY